MRKLLPVILAALAGFWVVPVGARIALHDDVGRELKLAKPAQRIVALAPHLVENLYAIGAGEQIVATVSWADYPAAARTLPRVGSNQSVSVEGVLAYKPDLVVLWASGNDRHLIERLQKLGIPVYASEPRELGGIGESLLDLGRLSGHEAEARMLATQLKAGFDTLAARYASQSPLKVFYQIWDEPLQTVNGEHLISAVIRLCGGRNVFADAAALAPRLSIESVVAANPQIIVGGQSRERLQGFWSRWSRIDAVRQQQVHWIDPDLMHRHGPRLLLGAQQLCQAMDAARAATQP